MEAIGSRQSYLSPRSDKCLVSLSLSPRAAATAVANVLTFNAPEAIAVTSAPLFGVVIVESGAGSTIVLPDHAEAATSSLLSVVSGEVTSVTPVDASSVSSAEGPTTVLGTISTTPAHAPAVATASINVGTSVATFGHKIISIQSIIRNYDNQVIYQTEVGDIKVGTGYGPTPPTTSAAANDTIISINSYVRYMDSHVVFENGLGEIKVSRGYGPTNPAAADATDIVSIYSFESLGGDQFVVTQTGAGAVKVSRGLP